MSIIGLVQKRGHKEISAIGTYAYDTENKAEIAFVVREDYQGMGIASYLLGVLEKIALENDYIQFSANVLQENKAMIQVFRKRYPKLRMSVQSGGEVLIEMDLGDTAQLRKTPDP
jgi:GNAT superfamily N-acetyltransferase